MAGKSAPHVDSETLKLLSLHSFPGNIRELRNILERARLFADDGVIRAEHLPSDLRTALDRTPPPLRRRHKESFAQLAQALDNFSGSRTELARHLGLSERTLYRRLRELGL
ncbi:Limonene hydroxylase [compost metagenome]